MKLPVQLSVYLLAAWLLAGCGFHLKGQVPSSLDAISINAATSEQRMENALKQQALLAGINLDDNAAWQVTLTNSSQSSVRTSATQASNRDQYRIKLTVGYQLHYQGTRLKDQSVTRQMRFEDNPDQALSKDLEREKIVNELRQETAQAILLQVEQLANNPPQCPCDEDKANPTEN